MEEKLSEVIEILRSTGAISGLDEPKVRIESTSTGCVITVDQMYSYVTLQFKTLDALSKFFHTDKIDVRNDGYSSGCETCDYGSNYQVKITIKN